MQHVDIPPPQSATVDLHPVASKLLLISRPEKKGKRIRRGTGEGERDGRKGKGRRRRNVNYSFIAKSCRKSLSDAAASAPICDHHPSQRAGVFFAAEFAVRRVNPE